MKRIAALGVTAIAMMVLLPSALAQSESPISDGLAAVGQAIEDRFAALEDRLDAGDAKDAEQDARLDALEAEPPPPPPEPALCEDTLDNDGDGLIDFPADPGCEAAADEDEFNAPPPPPPSNGTEIRVTDQQWECRQPVMELATNGLPLRVTVAFTRNNPSFGAFLAGGCVGDGTPATDIVFDIQGDGLTFGAQDDAIRLANATPGPSDLQIEGHADCGNQQGTAFHQDGVHVIGGTNVTFRNFTIGDYEAGEATCQGAGGVMFITGHTPSNNWPTNIRVEGGRYIGCNHGFNNGGQGTGHVEGASFRSSRVDGSHPKCDSYTGSPPCLFNGLVTRGPDVVCQRWNGTAFE